MYVNIILESRGRILARRALAGEAFMWSEVAIGCVNSGLYDKVLVSVLKI